MGLLLGRGDPLESAACGQNLGIKKKLVSQNIFLGFAAFSSVLCILLGQA